MKLMSVFGTRPEAIKMAPIIQELKKHSEVESIVCVTGQHDEMLQQVLDVFSIKPEYNLKIMEKNQTLFTITQNILKNIERVLEDESPELVLVHGDTSTAFVTSLACFYLKIPVAHVEAGLRTYDIYSPYPEEFNRQAIGLISKFNFCPTERSKNNLLAEGKNSESVFVTGNTVIDAMKTTISSTYRHPYLEWVGDDRLILLTAHRRENFGQAFENIFNAAKDIVNMYNDVKIICPMHPNPAVRNIAKDILGNESKVKLIEPLNVIDFHNFMARSYFIMSDSGGIQEEAPSLGKPVLVLRNTTERPEGIEAGTLKLIGNDRSRIVSEASLLLNNPAEYEKMSKAKNPYGDGFASERIINIILNLGDEQI